MNEFDTLYQNACNHEPTEEEADVLQFLLDKEYTDVIEAITLAYIMGTMTK